MRSINASDIQLRVLEKEIISCRDVARLMDDYTDQELSTTLRARLDAHIRRCPECQELRSSYRWVCDTAHELGQAPFDRGVQNRLRQALNQRLGLNLPDVR